MGCAWLEDPRIGVGVPLEWATADEDTGAQVRD
jgi:hypothetical protein